MAGSGHRLKQIFYFLCFYQYSAEFGWMGLCYRFSGDDLQPLHQHPVLLGSDLHCLRSEADYRLFHELRRRVDTEILVAGSDSGATVGDMAGGTVFSAGGMRLQVEKDRIYSLSDGTRKDLAMVEEFRKRPGAVMKRLMRYAEVNIGDVHQYS